MYFVTAYILNHLNCGVLFLACTIVMLIIIKKNQNVKHTVTLWMVYYEPCNIVILK